MKYGCRTSNAKWVYDSGKEKWRCFRFSGNPKGVIFQSNQWTEVSVENNPYPWFKEEFNKAMKMIKKAEK